MAIRTFILTDQWKTPSMGDAEGTGSILRHGISGDVTLTPVVPPGLRVEDDPRAWAMLSRPLRASYHLGRLIGPDGRDGVRLLGWVDEHPVSWRVQRELRFNGERLPRLPAVTITPAGDVVHLPDAAPVDEADLEAIGQVLVDLGAVRDELAAAVDAEQGAVAARDVAQAAAQEAREAADEAASTVASIPLIEGPPGPPGPPGEDSSITRPAMWVWDGTPPWTAPAEARPIDTVLNTATGEVHSIVEVTA